MLNIRRGAQCAPAFVRRKQIFATEIQYTKPLGREHTVLPYDHTNGSLHEKTRTFLQNVPVNKGQLSMLYNFFTFIKSTSFANSVR